MQKNYLKSLKLVTQKLQPYPYTELETERNSAHIHLDLDSLRLMPNMHGKEGEKQQSFAKSESWTSWVRFWLENCYPRKHCMISKEHDKISINNAIR